MAHDCEGFDHTTRQQGKYRGNHKNEAYGQADLEPVDDNFLRLKGLTRWTGFANEVHCGP